MSPPPDRPPLGRPAWAWAFYDWANSAFILTVITIFYGPVFQGYWYGGTPEQALWWVSLSVTASSLLVALLAPVLGALAESGPVKRRYLAIFMSIGAAATVALALLPEGAWKLALGLRLVASVGFFGSLVFYDALLPLVSKEGNRHLVSGLGFSLGYLGSLLLFIGQYILVERPELLGLAGRMDAIQLSFLTVAAWWLVFTLPVLIWVKEPTTERLESFSRALHTIGRDLAATLRSIRAHRPLLLFLLAYYLYIDGVNTLTQLSSAFGTRLGIEQTDLLGTFLLVQLVGVPCAVLLGWLGQRFRPRPFIIFCITIYLGVTAYAGFLRVEPLNLFGLAVPPIYIMGLLIGLVQGGLQALSRSYFISLLPDPQNTTYFGFYNMLGKGGAILGPLLMGGVGLMFADPRLGAFAVAGLFIAGLVLFSRVPKTSSPA